ncbi:MAG: glycosyltransferase, partial [Acidimicrobiales bacterium]
QAGVTTILEAMAMERPVICTATEGQTDVVEDGVNGLYVPPGDVRAMRQAIERLIADPDAAADMGKRGRELVEKRADVRLYADLFGDVVRSHVDGNMIGEIGHVIQLTELRAS